MTFWLWPYKLLHWGGAESCFSSMKFCFSHTHSQQNSCKWSWLLSLSTSMRYHKVSGANTPGNNKIQSNALAEHKHHLNNVCPKCMERPGKREANQVRQPVFQGEQRIWVLTQDSAQAQSVLKIPSVTITGTHKLTLLLSRKQRKQCWWEAPAEQLWSQSFCL